MQRFILPLCLASAVVVQAAALQPAIAAPVESNTEANFLIGGEYTRSEVEDIVRIAALGDARVPTSLALAVARVESNFNANAESPKGARGVMQIMPATALNEYGVAPDLLWDPTVNAELGVRFLGDLFEMYNNDWELALSHYNGGSLHSGRAHNFTRGYVSNVQRWQARYAPENPPGADPILVHTDPSDLLGGPTPLRVPRSDVGTACTCADDRPRPIVDGRPSPTDRMIPIVGGDRASGWRARAAAKRVEDARIRVRNALIERGAYD